MEPRGLRKVGVATLIVGLVLGIIVPFTQFGGVFPAPWVLGVSVLPVLWGVLWTWLARGRKWWVWLLAQWGTLSVSCWWFLGSATGWSSQALLGGVVFGALLLAVWMLPVAVIAAFPLRR